MKRFSQKREDILSLIRQTDTHPDAEWVYRQLKDQHPDLSLGTVYRNLNEMKTENMISSVGIVGERERFDGRTEPHSHIICQKCGRIVDMDHVSLPAGLMEEAQKHTDFEITYSTLQFVGICAHCRRNRSTDR